VAKYPWLLMCRSAESHAPSRREHPVNIQELFYARSNGMRGNGQPITRLHFPTAFR